jgi:hypothetical protein
MILFYDPKQNRITSLAHNALCWKDSAWRNSDATAIIPTPETAWFLVHNNDWDTFVCKRDLMGESFSSLPVIRFTGGDPTGKPDDEYWVRHRIISRDSKFTIEELTVLDNWVINGQKEGGQPWLLFEDKPHYLRGLLILLKFAQQIDPPSLSHDSKRKWPVDSIEWWNQRLGTESDWDKLLLKEYSRRKQISSNDILNEFINWAQHNTEYKLFGPAETDQSKSDPPKTRLAELIEMLERIL